MLRCPCRCPKESTLMLCIDRLQSTVQRSGMACGLFLALEWKDPTQRLIGRNTGKTKKNKKTTEATVPGAYYVLLRTR